MPKKTVVYRMDFKVASRLFTREKILAMTATASLRTAWEKDGVPASIVLTLMDQQMPGWYRDAEDSALPSRLRHHVAARLDPAVAAAIEDLKAQPSDARWVTAMLRILREGGEKRRGGITSNIEAFIDSIEKEISDRPGGYRKAARLRKEPEVE